VRRRRGKILHEGKYIYHGAITRGKKKYHGRRKHLLPGCRYSRELPIRFAKLKQQ
jgi:hypothetical protein